MRVEKSRARHFLFLLGHFTLAIITYSGHYTDEHLALALPTPNSFWYHYKRKVERMGRQKERERRMSMHGRWSFGRNGNNFQTPGPVVFFFLPYVTFPFSFPFPVKLWHKLPCLFIYQTLWCYCASMLAFRQDHCDNVSGVLPIVTMHTSYWLDFESWCRQNQCSTMSTKDISKSPSWVSVPLLFFWRHFILFSWFE